jgi:hypothetical protein
VSVSVCACVQTKEFVYLWRDMCPYVCCACDVFECLVELFSGRLLV